MAVVIFCSLLVEYHNKRYTSDYLWLFHENIFLIQFTWVHVSQPPVCSINNNCFLGSLPFSQRFEKSFHKYSLFVTQTLSPVAIIKDTTNVLFITSQTCFVEGKFISKAWLLV